MWPAGCYDMSQIFSLSVFSLLLARIGIHFMSIIWLEPTNNYKLNSLDLSIYHYLTIKRERNFSTLSISSTQVAKAKCPKVKMRDGKDKKRNKRIRHHESQSWSLAQLKIIIIYIYTQKLSKMNFGRNETKFREKEQASKHVLKIKYIQSHLSFNALIPSLSLGRLIHCSWTHKDANCHKRAMSEMKV
jgi:hypothetical protein